LIIDNYGGLDEGCALRGNHPAAAAAPLHRGDRGLDESCGDSRPRNPRPTLVQPSSNPRPHPLCGGVPPAGGGVVSRRRAPSLRSTGKPAIRRTLQVRSNPVPGGKHTDYVSQTITSTLDCFAAFQWYVSRVRWRLRKDGLGEAQPCPGAMHRDGGRGYAAHGAGTHPPQPTSKPTYLIFDI
jgi:hypothetical protein